MTAPIIDPRAALMAAPMSAYQKLAVGITVCLCMLDGFDVMAITFAAPAIRAAWRVGPAQIGLVLACSLLGMAAGSLLIAPAADRIGRRTMIFINLAIMITGDVLSANTHGVHQLMFSRVFTGLGIGSMVAVVSSLAAEYASARSRDLCLTIFGAGFATGGLIGGLGAAVLLPLYGWRAMFAAGACFGVLMLVVVWSILLDPLASLIARPRRDTLTKVNAYLKRCGMAPVVVLPPPPRGAGSAPMQALFGRGMAGATILLTAIYFLHVVTLFFVQSWLPSLIVGAGFRPGRAALIAVWLNVGGIIGGLSIGASSARFGLKPLLIAAMTGGALLTALFGFLPADFALLALGSAAMGFCLQGGMMGLYAAVARTFPAHVRVSGTGFVIGVGRIGSALGPALAGQLLNGGLARSAVGIAMAVPALAGALLLLKFRLQPPDLP